jgi:peptidyl-prolyl cis-trans isomerase D
MFEFIRRHTRWALGFVLLLIIPSFVFFGVEGYTSLRDAGNSKVAEVDGQSITQMEWDRAHQRNIERMRQQMPGVDVKLLDGPEQRRLTLDSLVRERVLLAAAQKQHLIPSDQRLQRLFVSDPRYASIRNPDGSVNKDLLASQGMSSEMLAQNLRLEVGMNQVLAGLVGSATAPKTVVSQALGAVLQRREVQGQWFEPKTFATQVKPSDADIEAYYKAKEAEFKLPEQASIEYVMLDVEGLKRGVTVSEEDLKKYYSENASRYVAAEERRARHILIKAEGSASPAEKQKAKAKAEELLADLRKAPTTFEALAKKHSQDPGSAERGGDLDYFGRGAMVKPFEDAAFGMKPGEISPVIESDFGYHIIKLEATRGGEKKSFDSVRAEIESEVKRQLAQRKFSESAEEFTNMVYEQADSLQPAVDKFKLEKKTATVFRLVGPVQTGPLANEKLLGAVFSTDSITKKRNTDAVDVGGSQLISARVLNHLPQRVAPLTEVRARVQQALVQEQAAALARKEGESFLAKAKQGSGVSLPEAVVVSRAGGAWPPTVSNAVLSADASKLPLTLGVDLGAQGYWVGKIVKVLPTDEKAAADPTVPEQLARAWASAESAAYYEALKKRHSATVKAPAAAASAAP